jgi:hypothetical protein
MHKEGAMGTLPKAPHFPGKFIYAKWTLSFSSLIFIADCAPRMTREMLRLVEGSLGTVATAMMMAAFPLTTSATRSPSPPEAV